MNTARRQLSCARVLGCLLALAGSPAIAGNTVLNSKHDLSVTGPGPIKASSETAVCVFCHTPHRGTGELPLWNHAQSTATYTPYSSSTTRATIGQPTGSSKLCLSCHDGTVALGLVHSRSGAIAMQNSVTTMPQGPSNLGIDLSDDHPVSFTYDSALAAADGQLKDPSTLRGKVRLDNHNQLQCTSCHDPHNDQYGKFLVQDNYASALCLQCHNMPLWQNASHATAPNTWNGQGVNPWPHTELKTVAANACENCHAPHTAGTKARLLNFVNEEENCFSCHSGTVAAKNIAAEFNKQSVHPIFATTGVHDPVENPINPPTRHVECADCHNSHAANATPATAPNASGALGALVGVNSSGGVINPLTHQYELCFRCHADSLTRGPATVPRQFVQTNTRLEFNPNNVSYHPVIAPGKNSVVPSLMSPWTTASLVYCTDCHNNDSGPNTGNVGPNGPHGSIYAPLLERNLSTVDFQSESIATYALCYKCHNRDSILADQSFSATGSQGQPAGHRFHIVDQQTACTTCHDSHGVQNVARLINFNSTYVTNSSTGIIQFTSTGPGSGTCTLSCHGKDHVNLSYPYASMMRPTAVQPKIKRR